MRKMDYSRYQFLIIKKLDSWHLFFVNRQYIICFVLLIQYHKNTSLKKVNKHNNLFLVFRTKSSESYVWKDHLLKEMFSYMFNVLCWFVGFKFSGSFYIKLCCFQNYDRIEKRNYYGVSSFSFAAPTLWNSLPDEIENTKSISSF